MKILVFNTLYYPNKKGGAERSVQLMCEEFSANNHKVEVISIWDKKSPKDSIINGVRAIKWRPSNIYSVHDYNEKKTNILMKLLWQFFDFFNIIMFFKSYFHMKKEMPDIVWTNNLSGFSLSIWCAAFINNVPIYHTARDYYLVSNNVQLYSHKKLKLRHNLISRCKLLMLNILSEKVHCFVGISEFILDLHKPFLKTRKTDVIYNSVNGDFSKSTTYIKNINNRTHLRYGYIGQINEAKGINDLLVNFTSYSNTSKLFIAGNDPLNYSSMYCSSNRVNFVGYVNSDAFFNTIDILLVPSKWDEPFGRVIIEAISNGIPVICSSSGGLNELSTIFESVICHDFYSLFHYDCNMVSFSSNDLDVINEKFSCESISSKYVSLFKQELK